MPKHSWTVNLPDGRHQVEIEHGYILRKANIRVDGELQKRIKFNVIEHGTEYPFQIGQHGCAIILRLKRWFEPSYDLVIDDYSVETGMLVEVSEERYIYKQSLKRGVVGNLLSFIELGIFMFSQFIAREIQNRVASYLTVAVGILIIALIEFIFTKWHHARIRRKFKGF